MNDISPTANLSNETIDSLLGTFRKLRQVLLSKSPPHSTSAHLPHLIISLPFPPNSWPKIRPSRPIRAHPALRNPAFPTAALLPRRLRPPTTNTPTRPLDAKSTVRDRSSHAGGGSRGGSYARWSTRLSTPESHPTTYQHPHHHRLRRSRVWRKSLIVTSSSYGKHKASLTQHIPPAFLFTFILRLFLFFHGHCYDHPHPIFFFLLFTGFTSNCMTSTNVSFFLAFFI